MDQPFVSPLSAEVDALWERRAELNPNDDAARALVTAAVDELDAGEARVAWVDPSSDAVVVDERAKRWKCDDAWDTQPGCKASGGSP